MTAPRAGELFTVQTGEWSFRDAAKPHFVRLSRQDRGISLRNALRSDSVSHANPTHFIPKARWRTHTAARLSHSCSPP